MCNTASQTKSKTEIIQGMSKRFKDAGQERTEDIFFKTLTLEDVIKRTNELDSAVDVIPCFVARDLGNLPPIMFDSLNVSVLLMKIEP